MSKATATAQRLRMRTLSAAEIRARYEALELMDDDVQPDETGAFVRVPTTPVAPDRRVTAPRAPQVVRTPPYTEWD
jgi:hypothetical protein